MPLELTLKNYLLKRSKEMKYELKNQIEGLLLDSDIDQGVIDVLRVREDTTPFNYESRAMSYLLSTGKLSFDDFLAMDEEYCKQNNQFNQYLYLFDMAPRTFGQTWGEKHIRELFPAFMPATKETLKDIYSDFDGEFDLWIDRNGKSDKLEDIICIEVKACRANSTATKGSLSSRAYSHEEAKEANFKYHYQQLKPSCCDVFIWIGVCKDTLMYWVLTREELLTTGKLGPQHRNENTGVEGAEVFEGQVFMTEDDLKPFLVDESNILKTVREKGKSKRWTTTGFYSLETEYSH